MNFDIEGILGLFSNFILLILILVFIAYLGVFVDYLRRSNITISSRIRLITSAILYSILSLASILGVVYIATGKNLLIDPMAALSRLINLGVSGVVAVIAGALLTLIFLGSLLIYIINRNETRYLNTLLFTTRLSIWPLIDAFWALVFFIIFLHYYPVCTVISLIAWSRISFISPLIFFAIFGIIIALIIFKFGPSVFLGGFYLVLGSFTLLLALILLAVSIIFPLMFPLMLAFMLIFLAIGIVMIILGILLASLGIVRVLGLFLIIFTALFFFSMSYLRDIAESVSTLPFISELLSTLPFISEAIPKALNMLENAATILCVGGIVVGILLLFFGGGREVGQIHTMAMALTVAVHSIIQSIMGSTLLPLSILSYVFIGNSSVLAVLIYITMTFLLRIIFAVKWLISPPRKQQKEQAEPSK